MQDFILKLLIKYDKIRWLPYIKKFLPVWFTKFKNGNTFWHYACIYQSINLLEYAKLSNNHIDELNEKGLSPLHSLIESSFFTRKNEEKIEFMMDEKFLEFFLSYNPDINLAWNIKIAVDTNSKNDILGTPLEVLIMTFWKHILTQTRKDYMSYYSNYENVFLTLCKHGANVNFLYEGEDFGKNDIIQDAMQKQKDRIVSHFFVKFISVTKDVYAIYPFFKNITTDFSILDEQKSNILHVLFGRLGNRYNAIDQQLGEKLILEIFNNPSFNAQNILDKNIFSSKAMDSFKRDKENYNKLINSYLIQDKLTNQLNDKPEPKTKIKKL